MTNEAIDTFSGTLDACIGRERPVIVQNGCLNWPATSRWCPDYLQNHYGTLPIRYRESKTGIHPDLTEEHAPPRETIASTLSAFLRILDGRFSCDHKTSYYMTGDIKTMTLAKGRSRRGDALGLLEDILLPGPCESMAHVGLWISPDNSHTWLHYDSGGVCTFFAQIRGAASVTMFSPDQLPLLYPFPVSCAKALNFSRVNIAAPDLTRFPGFSEANGLEGKLHEGDVLFIPWFWFYSVRNSAPLNINVSMSIHCKGVPLSLTSLRSAILIQAMRILRATSAEVAETQVPPFSRADVLGAFDRLMGIMMSLGGVQYF